MNHAMKWILSMASLAMFACGGSSPEGGGLRVSVASSALSSDPRVTSVWVQLLGVDSGMNWAGVQGEIYNSKADKSGEWQAFFDKIPVGHVSFYAEARGAGGEVYFKILDPRPVYEVKARTTTNVVLVLQDTQAKKFQNQAPYIQTLIYSDADLDPAASLALAAAAGDADGDALTVAWTSDGGGIFADAAALSTTWTPPGEGTFNLTLSVTDTQGARAAVSFRINVAAKNAKGGFYMVVDLNNFPAIAQIETSDAQGHAGSPIQLTAHASDADGDSLQFVWSADCAGTMTSAAEVATFTPASTGACTFTVEVKDFYASGARAGEARGGSNTGTITIQVGNVSGVEAPHFYIKLVTPVDIYPGQRAEVQVMPASGHSEPTWHYAWSDGGFGGAFAMRTNDGFTDDSDEWYTPRACASPTPLNVTITAIVTDTATTGTASESLNVIVHCQKTNDVLILGTTVTGGMSSAEAQVVTSLGLNPVILDAAHWAALTMADVGAARAIVLGTPIVGGAGCSGADPAPIAPADGNKAVWSPNVTGNVLVAGNDPAFHFADSRLGAAEFLHDAIAFATYDPLNTGAYISLACYYSYTGNPDYVPVPVLDGFGSFTTRDQISETALIVGTHPAFTGLTSADLSNWGTSIHELVDTSGASAFSPFAVAVLGSGNTPYIVGRGISPLP